MKSVAYLIITLLSIQILCSQTHIYEHFGVDDGLPSSEVFDLYQDRLGYMWFATDKGMSRYNGYEFENFTTKDGLPGNTILDFYPQKDGRVFCLEYHGNTLFYFDTVFDGFKMVNSSALISMNPVGIFGFSAPSILFLTTPLTFITHSFLIEDAIL